MGGRGRHNLDSGKAKAGILYRYANPERSNSRVILEIARVEHAKVWVGHLSMVGLRDVPAQSERIASRHERP